jgi:hypothetical protein
VRPTRSAGAAFPQPVHSWHQMHSEPGTQHRRKRERMLAPPHGMLVLLAVFAVVVTAGAAIVLLASSVGDGKSADQAPAATSARRAHSGGRRWYAPRSLWNVPIGPHPRIAPNNATLIAALVQTPAIGVSYDYTPAIWYATSSTPGVPVRIDVPRCNARTVWVPIPRGAVPDSSSEGHMAIAQFGTGTEFDFYKAQSPNRPPKSSVYYPRPCPTVNEWTAATVVSTNWETGSGSVRFSTRGSGTTEGAGTILPRDTEMPPGATWDHALGMSYKNTCSDAMRWCPVVAPATQEDGTCTDRSRCVPEGARFQLDPSLNCNTWPSLRYVWQRQMCRTLQVYGGIVIDTNAGGPTFANQWHGSLISYSWPWIRQGDLNLPHDLLSHFLVLAWQ